MTEYKLNYIFERVKDGEASLRVRVKWNRNKYIVSISPHVRVEVAKWSCEFNRCKPRTVHTKYMVSSTIINEKLDRLEMDIERTFAGLPDVPSKEVFHHAFNVNIGKDKEVKLNLLTLFSKFLEEEGTLNNWADSTIRSLTSTYNHMRKFRPVWTEEDFTESTLSALLRRWALNRMRNSTVDKNVTNIKWYLGWLSKKSYYTGDLHKTFSPRLKMVEDIEGSLIVYLTWEELIRLYEMPMPSQTWEYVRDAFCLCCFTSLRYSDLYNLKRSDVDDNYIRVVTEKTADGIRIDLNDYSRAILNKYKDIKFRGNKVMYVYSNQKMNQYLKEIAKYAGFVEPVMDIYYVGAERHEDTYAKWERITTHCGRRTFIVNALYLGIPAEVIIRWTGHADYNEMRPYIAIVDDLRAREMNKFNVGVPKSPSAD